MRRPVPTFVVAGAARAGTTGLVEGLRARPDVFVTTPKEPHYLAFHGSVADFRGPGDEETVNRRAVVDEHAYLSLFPSSSPHLALGEGSVSTLYHHGRALPELLRLNPDARVVVLLRDPVARAWSSFQYLRAQGREPEEDFLEALAQEPRRRRDNWHHLWHYRGMSLYAESVAALRSQLPGDRVGVWFHDDLERDYAGTLRQVEDFLGLPVAATPAGDVPRVNASGTMRHPRVHRGLAWAARHPLTGTAARSLTSWRFREAVRTRLLRRDGVPEHVERALRPEFTEDLARLRDLCDPDRVLPAWLAATDRVR